MDEDEKHSKGEGSPAPGDSKELFPKPENLDSEQPSETMNARPHRDSVPSLPETSVRETLIAMGFSPSRVDQAMKENGEENIDLLLDVLSDPVPSLPQTSVRESLIRMGSSPSRVDEAIKEHGEEDLDTLLDALSSDSSESSSDSLDSLLENVFGHEDSSAPPNFSPGASRKEDCNDESLFGITGKTLRLREMGFSENEISLAIERLGSEATIQELAGSICEDQIGGHNLDKAKLSSMASSSSHSQSARNHTENVSLDAASNSTNIISSNNNKGKRPIVEYDDDFPDTASQRRPKHGDDPDTIDED